VKTIGLLHGMSSVATGDYYRKINDRVNGVLGGHERPELLLYSVNFGDIERFVRGERWSDAADYLTDRAMRLQAAGADFVVCGSNTMHRVAPALEAALDVPFVHIVDVVADAALQQDVQVLGVLGTRPVMEADFYRERLAGRGIEMLTPPAADRTLVDEVIFDELTQHTFRAESREEYLRVVRELADRGAQAVLLGCTEICLLVQPGDVPGIALLDSTELHVDRVVQLALS
jgi:aspartate racemase